MTRLQNGRSEVRIPSEARHVSLLQNVETGSGTRPGFYSRSRFLSREESARSVELSPCSTEVKNGWSETSIPLTSLLRGQRKRSLLTARKHTCTFTNHLLHNPEDCRQMEQPINPLVLWYVVMTGVTGKDRRTS